MAKLPPEVLDRIADSLPSDSSYTSRACLFKARLTSKAFNARVERRLFRSVSFCYTLESFTNMCNVSQSETLRHCVQEVRISSSIIRYELEYPSLQWFEPQNGPPNADDGPSDEALLARSKYIAAHQGFVEFQRMMSKDRSDVAILVECFKSMPNLRELNLTSIDKYLAAREVEEAFGHLTGSEFQVDQSTLYLVVLKTLAQVSLNLKALSIYPMDTDWEGTTRIDPHPWPPLPITWPISAKGPNFSQFFSRMITFPEDIGMLPFQHLRSLEMAPPALVATAGALDAGVGLVQNLLKRMPVLTKLGLFTNENLQYPAVSALLPREPPLRSLRDLHLFGPEDQHTITETMMVYFPFLSHIKLMVTITGPNGDLSDWFEPCDHWREHSEVATNLQTFLINVPDLMDSRDIAPFLQGTTPETDLSSYIAGLDVLPMDRFMHVFPAAPE